MKAVSDKRFAKLAEQKGWPVAQNQPLMSLHFRTSLVLIDSCVAGKEAWEKSTTLSGATKSQYAA